MIAVNEAGKSKPSRPSVNVLVEEQPNKPCLDLSGVRDITVKAGEDFSIHIPYVGFPLPTATWFNNDQIINDTDSRVHIQVKYSIRTQYLLVIHLYILMIVIILVPDD